ncbi:LPD1 domain-containing protein [Arcicella sp. DC2W]|uniref:LPD1 domain-containing protein n=1 Tax=Arcicella gelida TaxID=2984195 RepID=A0ABU5S7P3_9BACT|nr:LPD1 domain-containing protein [Arcicella sp. DC2W]MEA5404481.1 LPD1 domain-containing protein [Arcicella sp. DC2W]
MAKTHKITDTSYEVSKGSRLAEYWQGTDYQDYTPFVRPNFTFPPSILKENNAIKTLQKQFGIKDLNFGNWVTQEDRFNYVNLLVISLYDLNKVLHFNQFLGFNQLSVAFGARGKSKALAHYEPTFKIINLTRYKRDDSPKIVRLITTGGMGSFAHEYGHFLDYFAGEYLDKDNSVFALTGGISIQKDRINVGSKLRNITDDILEKIIWKTPNKVLSPYYVRLTKVVSDDETLGEYWIRRNEIFARWFEAWVSHELQLQNIENKLLAQSKYLPIVYPTKAEIVQLSPLFKQFCKEFKTRLFV